MGSRRVVVLSAIALAAASAAAVLVNPSATSGAATGGVVRLNAGGSAVVDGAGIAWDADQYYTGGRSAATSSQIVGTADQSVYLEAREGMRRYSVPVTDPGTYRVRLRFAEPRFTSSQRRVFDVRAEGATIVHALDLVAVAGPKTAYDLVRDVVVNDGSLTLRFVAITGRALVSAIEVAPVRASTSTTTTASPQSTTTTTASTTTSTVAPTTTTTAAPTTTTTTTAPRAPAPVTAGFGLTWAPPALTTPTMVTVGPGGGTFNLAAGRDYIVQIPQTVSAAGGVRLVGGRNVVLIGGHITIPMQPASASINDRRALYINGQTGVVHIEGLLIDNSGGDLSEGIQIAAPQATIQIQNVRITGIHARDEVGFTDNHPDLVQPWGGAKEIRIDRFSGSTDYQGLFLKADLGTTIGRADVRNVDIWGEPANLGRYMLWQGPDNEADPHYELAYTNVWLRPATGRSLGKTVWPDVDYSLASRRAILSADGQSVTWPAGSWIVGTVRQGTPPGGSFVPLGVAGVGYVSPGYGS